MSSWLDIFIIMNKDRSYVKLIRVIDDFLFSENDKKHYTFWKEIWFRAFGYRLIERMKK